MVVGLGRLVFSLPGNDSLKGKRSYMRRIIDRTRARYNVAIAEVDEQDNHGQLVIGFTVVSNDRRHARSMLDAVVSFATSTTEAVLVDSETDVDQWEAGDP